MWLSALRTIPVIGALCGIGYSLFTLWCVATFRTRPQKKAQTVFTPPISILKPLCGLDPHGYDTLRSHCVQDYPAFEIVFGVSDPNDAVVRVVERLIAEFPAIPIKLVPCPLVLGGNLKISNLIQMLPEARHEFLLINDSDIGVPGDYLRRVIAYFEDPAVGMVTCLYRGIAGSSFGSKLEALGISSDFMPGVLCARHLEGIRFALGSTLLLSRRTLEMIGGLDVLADHLADDYQLGYRTSQAGLRVELADCVVEHWLPAYTFSAFLKHQLRWARAIRSSRPEGYAGLIFTFVVPWSFVSVLAMQGATWTWALFAVAVVLRYTVTLLTQVHVLGDRRGLRDLWLLPARDFVGLLVWIACYMGRHVVWRGRRFKLVNGKLRGA
jgi:ceramide glucosyltransferase